MIIVYHLSESRSERLVWLMEELGSPYELQEFKRLPSMSAPPEYRALHPMGVSPMIRDGDEVLIESGAIVEHILLRHGRGKLRPAPASPDHTRYLQWLHFAEGTAMNGLMNEALINMSGGAGAESAVMGMLRDRNDRMMDYIESELGQHDYFAGNDFTAADIMMAFIFPVYKRFVGRPLEPYPNICRYVRRIEERPAYQHAMARANPGAPHW